MIFVYHARRNEILGTVREGPNRPGARSPAAGNKGDVVEPFHLIYLCPAVAVLALVYAYLKASWVKKQDEGTDRMKMIGGWIADGAMAFLAREYRVLAIFVIAVAVLLGVSNQMIGEDTNWIIAVSFVLGAFCSALAGYFGMKTATAANTRTAAAARKGLNEALQVAFNGGSVMGLSVVGLALTGMGVLFIVYTKMYPTALTDVTAMRLVLNILSGFSYTIESIIQAASKGLCITSVPIRTNPKTRESRLMRSTTQFIVRSAATILRISIFYRPLRFFTWVGALLLLAGGAIGVRFLYLLLAAQEAGHTQSLILTAILIIMGFVTLVLGILADLISVNRRLQEEILYRLRIEELRSPEAGRIARHGARIWSRSSDLT